MSLGMGGINREILDTQNDLVSKRDLQEAFTELKNIIIVLEKTTSLKFSGLYTLTLIVACGVAKLVFYP
jgi:hypothetical protein